MINKQQLTKLRKFAKQFDVKIIQIKSLNYTYYFEHAPFISEISDSVLGIDWEDKKIYFKNLNNITDLVHELAHVVCDVSDPNEKDPCPEDYTFYWEMLVSLKIGVTYDDFLFGQKEYRVTNDGSISVQDCIDSNLQHLIHDYLWDSKHLGMMIGIVDSKDNVFSRR